MWKKFHNWVKNGKICEIYSPRKFLRYMVCLNSLVFFYLCNSLDAVSQLLITSERAWNILSSGLLLSSHPGSIMTGEESSWLPLLAPPPPPPPRPVTVVAETITMATVTVATHLLARQCISSSPQQGLLECRLRWFLLEVMWSMRDCHVTDLFRRLRRVFYRRSSWWGLLWNCCLYWGPLRPYMECDEEQFHLQPRARKFFNVQTCLNSLSLPPSLPTRKFSCVGHQTLYRGSAGIVSMVTRGTVWWKYFP